MIEIDLKLTTIVVSIITIVITFFNPFLSLSFLLGFFGFIGYYFFLSKRIEMFLANGSKFLFYLSIILSILLMGIPFVIVTLIQATAANYCAVALGFISFKIIMNVKTFFKK